MAKRVYSEPNFFFFTERSLLCLVYPRSTDYFISRYFIDFWHEKLRNAGSDLGAAVKGFKRR